MMSNNNIGNIIDCDKKNCDYKISNLLNIVNFVNMLFLVFQ